MGQNGISYIGPKVWNKVTSACKLADNPNIFKHKIKEEFQEKYDRWTEEINETVKRNSIDPKRINKSKKIKLFHI